MKILRTRSAAFSLSFAILAANGAVLASESSRIGVAAAVRGDVQLTSLGAQEGHRPHSGESLFLGDRVTSGADSHLQILLLDKTTFTLGEDCDLTIDRFVYDPATKAGEIQASVTKGAFRFVTGEVPHRDPDALTIKIPSGTLGVRGTIGEAVVGMAALAIAEASGLDISAADPEMAVLVVLRGPGQNLNTSDRIGQVTLTAGGQEVVLTRPNWASFIAAPSAAPTDAFEIGGPLEATLIEPLRPRSTQQADAQTDAEASGAVDPDSEDAADGAGGTNGGMEAIAADGAQEDGSASDDAGQTIAAGVDLSDLQFGTAEQQLLTTEAAELVVDNSELVIADGPARASDFLMRQGIATFTSTGVPMDDGGSYDYSSTVNFDTRSWNSTATWTSPSTFNGTISGSGTINLAGNDPLHRDSVQLGPGVDVMLHERLMNRNGQPAGEMWHWLLVSDGVNEAFGEDYVQ